MLWIGSLLLKMLVIARLVYFPIDFSPFAGSTFNYEGIGLVCWLVERVDLHHNKS